MQMPLEYFHDLIFSYNWNNKLDCNCFTTIRLDGKWQVGQKVIIKLKGADKGKATIKEVKPFYLKNLNPYISFLDTGYDVTECRNIILRMYPKINFDSKKLALILIVKDKEQ